MEYVLFGIAFVGLYVLIAVVKHLGSWQPEAGGDGATRYRRSRAALARRMVGRSGSRTNSGRDVTILVLPASIEIDGQRRSLQSRPAGMIVTMLWLWPAV